MSSISPALKRSWPAGTGVCVVKTTSGATRGSCLVKPDPFFLHALANRLQDGKCAVAFVEMENAGRDSHRGERAEAADAQEHLLPDAQAHVAAIEARRKVAVLGRIALHIRIEQEQIATTDFQPPDLCANGAAAHFNLDADWLALRPDRRLQGQPAHFGREVRLLLPAAGIEILPKISLPVE